MKLLARIFEPLPRSVRSTVTYLLKVAFVVLVAYLYVHSYVSRAVDKDARFWSMVIIGACVFVWGLNKAAVVLYTKYAPSRLKSPGRRILH